MCPPESMLNWSKGKESSILSFYIITKFLEQENGHINLDARPNHVVKNNVYSKRISLDQLISKL
jgi:hypothetical protein